MRVVRDDEPDFLVTMADVNRLGWCHKGARDFFRERGLVKEWTQFVKFGLSAKWLASFEHGGVNMAIEAARKRHQRRKVT